MKAAETLVAWLPDITANRAEVDVAWLLDRDERSRLDAFAKSPDRRRFIFGAALARVMVARVSGVAAEVVQLDRTCYRCGQPRGRPVVVAPDCGVELSVSHSGGLVAVAVRIGGRVGIDIESLDWPRALERVATLALGPAELEKFGRTKGPERHAALLRLWTRKEAVVKMMGRGLAVDLPAVMVSGPNEPPRLVAWPDFAELVGRVHLYDLDPQTAGHVAALALLDSPTGYEVVNGEAALKAV